MWTEVFLEGKTSSVQFKLTSQFHKLVAYGVSKLQIIQVSI